MTQNVKDKLLMCLRRTAIAIFAIGAIAGTVHANPPGPEEYAVLDLTRVGDPTLITVPGHIAGPDLGRGPLCIRSRRADDRCAAGTRLWANRRRTYL